MVVNKGGKNMFAETVIQATFYMFFVSFSAGLGLLGAASIGYKLYTRQNTGARKRGNR